MAAPVWVSGAYSAGSGFNAGSTTRYITFVPMPDPPVAGDIVFGNFYQYNTDNSGLAVSAGWTVDAQHNAATGSWIVFHRAIEAGDLGPTVSGITTGVIYSWALWTYRNFNGFDGGPVVAYSDSAVLNMDTGTITRTEPDSLTVVEWTVPNDGNTYNENNRIRMPAGTDGVPVWLARHDTLEDKWYDNSIGLPVAAGTLGPITAKRRNISTFAYSASPYVSVIYALRAVPLSVGGWGVGMIRMGAN